MAVAFYRMVPDVRKGGGNLTTRGGAKVAIAANTFIDLPLEDASRLEGWTNCGRVGTSAQRPENASINQVFIDTTLGKAIFSNGQGLWHDPFTGNQV